MIRPALCRFLCLFFFLSFAAATGTRAAGLPDTIEFSRVIELGNVRQARAWLDDGLSPDFEGQPIGTGVMIAAWTGNIPMMELFVERGADVNKTNVLGEQALLHAAWKGQRGAVEWLLAHGAKVSRDGKAWAALHYATFAGHGEVVRLLLASGANVNALSSNGSTPLMMAAREGREAIAVNLLQAGADPTVTNEWGDDAQTWALRQRNTNIARLVGSSDPALRKPVPTGLAQRSLPVNDVADKLLSRARYLEAQGRREEALMAFRAAMAALKRSERDQALAQARNPKESARQLTGMRITARRDNPQAQSANLNYARPATEDGDAAPEANLAQVGAGETAYPSGMQSPASGTARGGAAPQDPVERLMAEARQLDAQGRRKEAMVLYRQAAAMLRQF